MTDKMLPPPPPGFVLETAPNQLPPPPAGFVLEQPGQSQAYTDALAAGSAASQRLKGGPGRLYSQEEQQRLGVDERGWEPPGMLAPIQKNIGGGMRFAVPQVAESLLDALALPGDAFAGKLDQFEVDPNTGEVAPFNSEMIERGANAAGWFTGNAPESMRTVVRTAAGKPLPEPIVRAAKADGVPLNRVADQLDEVGPDAVLADLGPNLRAQAATIASRPGADSADTIIDAMSARHAGGNQRIRSGIDDTIGPAPIPSQLKADIQKAKRIVGPEYDRVLAGAPPVDTTNIAKSLDDAFSTKRGAAQGALREVRSMLDGFDGELDTSATVLHQVREAVDGMLENPPDGNTRTALRAARDQINELLVEAVPAIQQVDSKYRELMRQSEAIDRGQTVLDSNRNAPRPSELADEMKAGAVPDGVLVGPSGTAFRLSQGTRAEIDRLVGNNADDRAALARILKGEGDWNRHRLVTIYGPERGQRLFDLLDAEARMADTENAVLGAAGKRARSTAATEIDPPQRGPGIAQEALNLRAGAAGAKLLDDLFGGHAEARQSKANAAVAGELMGRGGWDVTERAPMSSPAPLQPWLADLISGLEQRNDSSRRQSMSDEELIRALGF